MGRKQSKCLKTIDVESDIISCLPDHLIDLILSYLSIKEAVQTSVLSSKWRKKWSTLSDLVFDSQCVSTVTSQDPSVIESKFLRIVDHVLLLHSGPINKFEISANSFQNLTIGVNSMADIDRWIFHISERYIKELVLDIWLYQRYKIPWRLYSCQCLHHLKLKCCLLKPPTTFEGFKNLKSLVLNRVTMTQDAFENIISGCPRLEKLTLMEMDDLWLKPPTTFEDFRNLKRLSLAWFKLTQDAVENMISRCPVLEKLKLREIDGLWLKPPTTFEGFRNLKSLSLAWVKLTQDAFDNMISGCPLLEKLTLENINGLTQINIHAPNLKSFDFYGEFERINFDDTFQLTMVSVVLISKSNQIGLHGCTSNLLKFFVHLPHIHNLFISTEFLKYLAAGIVPVKLPTPCINLRYFRLFLNFNDLKKISVVLCLLNSSPNLRNLEIFAARNEKESGLLTPASCGWEDIFSEPSMPLGVQHVMMEGISGTKSELDFIQFLLLYSPVLEKMTVKPIANVRTEVMTELIRFKRASRQAEVIYIGKDSS